MVIEGLWVGKGERAVEPLAAVDGLGLILGWGGGGGMVWKSSSHVAMEGPFKDVKRNELHP
jgi:hypothetical protein